MFTGSFLIMSMRIGTTNLQRLACVTLSVPWKLKKIIEYPTLDLNDNKSIEKFRHLYIRSEHLSGFPEILHYARCTGGLNAWNSALLLISLKKHKEAQYHLDILQSMY